MNETIIMFDMDGTLLDLAFDQFIWNEHLPQHAFVPSPTLPTSGLLQILFFSLSGFIY